MIIITYIFTSLQVKKEKEKKEKKEPADKSKVLQQQEKKHTLQWSTSTIIYKKWHKYFHSETKKKKTTEKHVNKSGEQDKSWKYTTQ